MKPLILVCLLGVVTHPSLYPMEQLGSWLNRARVDISRKVSLEVLAFIAAATLVTGALYFWKKVRREASHPLGEPDIPSPQPPVVLSQEPVLPVAVPHEPAKEHVSSLPECLAKITINEQQAYDELEKITEKFERLWNQVEQMDNDQPLQVLEKRYQDIKQMYDILKREYGVLQGLISKFLEPPDQLYGNLTIEYERNLSGVDPKVYYTLVNLSIDEGVCLSSDEMLEKIKKIAKGIGGHPKEFVQRQLTYVFSKSWSKKFYDLWLKNPDDFLDRIIRVPGGDLMKEYTALQTTPNSPFMKLANYLDKLQTTIRKDKEWQRVEKPTH